MMPLGAILPDITLVNQHGQKTSLKAYCAVKPAVIFFYPKDNTPGCTVEACAFRDQYEDFVDAGAVVIGISTDSESSHARFSQQYRLPYLLLSDPDKKAQKAFNVPKGLFGLLPGRVTYIFDENGKLIHHFASSLQPLKHMQEALDAIRKLKRKA